MKLDVNEAVQATAEIYKTIVLFVLLTSHNGDAAEADLHKLRVGAVCK